MPTRHAGRAVAEAFGAPTLWASVDTVVANVGGATIAAAHETSPEEWRRVLDLNLTASYLAMSAAAERMLRRRARLDRRRLLCAGHARVSRARRVRGREGRRDRARPPDGVDYGPTASASTPSVPAPILTEGVRAWLDGFPDPPRASASSRRWPALRERDAAEVAAAILWLACDESSYVSGHALVVDGGLTVVGQHDVPSRARGCAVSVSALRSRAWFDDPANTDMTALYLERMLNYGLTLDELQSGRPIIGIAQTGSDITPCNRHHLALATRVREGVRDAGGIAFEFPIHPIQETCKRPTAMLDRNLQYLSLVEILYGYPLDGVVLTTGCDKTTPAQLMAAATVDIPAIVLSGGPMLNGWFNGERTGSGTIVWRARELMALGEHRREAVHRRSSPRRPPRPGTATRWARQRP